MNTTLKNRLHRKPQSSGRDRPPAVTRKRPAWSAHTGNEDRRRLLGALAAAVAVALIAAAIAVLVINDGDGSTSTPLELSAGNDATASCLPFDIETLARMPTAFAGTVTQIQDGAITLDVDRWYAGGDAEAVRLTTVENADALLGGIPFAVGSQYLLTASDGVLSYCGYSGPVTPEFQNSFDAAFAG